MWLDVTFSNGSIRFSYEKPFETTVRAPGGCAGISLDTDYYPAVSFLDFQNFIEGVYTHGHIGRGIASVRFNETMRAVGTHGL